MEKYTIVWEPDEKGEVAVRRASDGRLAMCKRSWLKPFAGAEGTFVPRSKVKAIRLDGLDWTEEL